MNGSSEVEGEDTLPRTCANKREGCWAVERNVISFSRANKRVLRVVEDIVLRRCPRRRRRRRGGSKSVNRRITGLIEILYDTYQSWSVRTQVSVSVCVCVWIRTILFLTDTRQHTLVLMKRTGKAITAKCRKITAQTMARRVCPRFVQQEQVLSFLEGELSHLNAMNISKKIFFLRW